MPSVRPPVVLFGYDSSPFTSKVRLALRLKQIPYTFCLVPSMMPRPVLRDNFHITYRKIPVCAIGRQVYCDTSIILEALEHQFPSKSGHGSLYPPTADGRTYRALIRGFASYWTDRPLFRATTGLIPSSVWRTHFGTDRSELIGHKLDPDKLEAKVPKNLSALDMHLSMLEPLFQESDNLWVFSTETPSLADISLYYQLDWGNEIAAGRGISNLTGGGTPDTNTQGAAPVFNCKRYPALYDWFTTMRSYMQHLPSTETRTEEADDVIRQLRDYEPASAEPVMVPTAAPSHVKLDAQNGLVPGTQVSVAPDDTGRADPTLGTLIALSTEEIVIKPLELDSEVTVPVNVHFPRLGFTVRPILTAKL